MARVDLMSGDGADYVYVIVSFRDAVGERGGLSKPTAFRLRQIEPNRIEHMRFRVLRDIRKLVHITQHMSYGDGPRRHKISWLQLEVCSWYAALSVFRIVGCNNRMEYL